MMGGIERDDANVARDNLHAELIFMIMSLFCCALWAYYVFIAALRYRITIRYVSMDVMLPVYALSSSHNSQGLYCYAKQHSFFNDNLITWVNRHQKGKPFCILLA